MSRSASVGAPAKVNLHLRVLGRRQDGYHDIDTLFQAIDLTDQVDVRVDGHQKGIALEVQGADLGPPEDNLAHRAAARFAEAFGVTDGIAIRLTKRIPAGAGLGGGSSDAAAVLRALARLFGVDERDPRLRDVALQVGSDVPFFLCGSPLARGRGRGEILEPLPPLGTADLVLVSPPVHVATADAYRMLAQSRAAAPGQPDARPLVPPRSWADIASRARNDFQPVIALAHREIQAAIDALVASRATFALMSGSGSSAFGLFVDRTTADAAAKRLRRDLACPCRAVRTLGAMPEVALAG